MELTLSLCMNCVNAPGCTLRNGHAVHECEEHQVAEFKSLNGFELSERIYSAAIGIEHFSGLCGNCELKDHCMWRDPDTITFHCEHYQ